MVRSDRGDGQDVIVSMGRET